MNDIELILQNEIRAALTRAPISFIVMNKRSHDLLILENVPLTLMMDQITKYQVLDVLISEDVSENGVKIG